jgi:hypothetical protein
VVDDRPATSEGITVSNPFISRGAAPATGAEVAVPEGRLSGIRRVTHDEDERPTREDLRYGETIFNRAPVPLPRLLTGRRRRG